ncbi:MAG: glycosyltransferase family 8 protein [Oscillospiraceae bacterium]|nr:glycosyltransferase family 8 protein [Oscillospiraceae bacterium]
MKNFNSRELHIVYASDNRFAEILGVSVISLYENNQSMKKIYVYVLDSGISEENKEKLRSVSRKYQRDEIQFISARNISQILSVDVSTDRGSLSQYARLFISRDLPQNLERVLYLDCDIIINDSLFELWNLNMKGKIIAALKDAFSRQYRKNIELHPDDVMFNSGVMLVDLKRWAEFKTEQKLLAFIKRHNGVIQQGDQGALNAVLSKETYCFHPKFNSVTIFYDFTYEEMLIYRRPVHFYSERTIQEAKEHPVIIHYTTSFTSLRPWIQGSQHPYKDKWLDYKKKSPWADALLWNAPEQNGLKGAYIKLSKKMPRWLMLRCSSLLQVYGRPFIYSLKK